MATTSGATSRSGARSAADGRRPPRAHADARLGLGRGGDRRSSSTPSARSASRGATSTRSRPSAARRSGRRLSFGWLALRTTRLPFLSATIIPVVLGIAIAASHGLVRPADRGPDRHRRVVRPARAQRRERRLRHGPGRRRRERHADPVQRRLARHPVRAGVVPPDGRARGGVLPGRGAIGLILLALRPSTALLVIGVVGIIVSLAYTAPPLKLVYRGLGEVAVAIGFGPLMLLGAYVVQTGGVVTPEAARRVAADRPPRRADPLRQRDPRPARRRAGRQADAAGAVLARRGHHRLPGRGGRGVRRSSSLGVAVGLLPIPALLALLTIPLALQVSRGLEPNYDNPYGLMAIMGVNIKVHLYAGLLLIAAYLVVLAVSALAPVGRPVPRLTRVVARYSRIRARRRQAVVGGRSGPARRPWPPCAVIRAGTDRQLGRRGAARSASARDRRRRARRASCPIQPGGAANRTMPNPGATSR